MASNSRPINGKHTTHLIAASIVAIGLLASLLLAYFGNPFRRDPTSSLVDPEASRDMSVEEAGIYAAPKYRSARQQHLANRRQYELLAYSPMVDVRSLAARLRPEVQSRIDSGSEATRRAAARVGSPAIDELCLHLSALLCATGPSSYEQYLAALPPGRRFVLPRNDAAVRYACDQFAPKASGWVDLRTDASLERVFRALFEASVDHAAGILRTAAYSVNPKGFALTLDEVPPERVGGDLLSNVLVQRDLLYWFGSLAQGALIFTAPETAPEMAGAGTRHLCAHAAFVVRAKGGETFPIHFQCWFDPSAGRWWLIQATRRSSIRAANGPPLVF